MSFTSTTFTFDGVSCKTYGMSLYNLKSVSNSTGTMGTKINLITDTIARRSRSISYGATNNTPLEFTLIFGLDTDNGRMDRYHMAAVTGWLVGHQDFKWLTIQQPDLENVRFKCKITELKNVEIGMHAIAFSASVVCDSPFAYLLPRKETVPCNGQASYLYRNQSNINAYYTPKIQFAHNGSSTSFTIKNLDDDSRTFSITGLPRTAVTIDIDCENQVMTASNGSDLYSTSNLQFLRFVRGDNNLVISGTGTLTIYSEAPINIGM